MNGHVSSQRGGEVDSPPWVAKAQRWLSENAAHLWAAWCATPQGRGWIASQAGGCRRRGHGSTDPGSPYSHGFSLPQYHHDLIEAVGLGDEERAKAIMLFEGYTRA
jgi:hypothetical protein